MSGLHRLVYTSFRKPTCNEQEIQKILESCKRNNPKRKVTGVLVHSNKRFLQYMEGEKKDLLELYELIKLDSRHGGVNQRNFEPIEARVFPSWEMGYKDAEGALDFHSAVSEEDRTHFQRIINDEIDFSDQGMKILRLFFKV